MGTALSRGWACFFPPIGVCASETNHMFRKRSRLLGHASPPQARESRRTRETGKRPWMRHPIDLPEVGTTMGPHTLMKAQFASPSDKLRICSHLDKRGLQPLPDESDSPGVRLCASYLTGVLNAISTGDSSSLNACRTHSVDQDKRESDVNWYPPDEGTTPSPGASISNGRSSMCGVFFTVFR